MLPRSPHLGTPGQSIFPEHPPVGEPMKALAALTQIKVVYRSVWDYIMEPPYTYVWDNLLIAVGFNNQSIIQMLDVWYNIRIL